MIHSHVFLLFGPLAHLEDSDAPSHGLSEVLPGGKRHNLDVSGADMFDTQGFSSKICIMVCF
jgi:hypothetical protein